MINRLTNIETETYNRNNGVQFTVENSYLLERAR